MTNTPKPNDGLSNPFCFRDPGSLPGFYVVPSEDHGAMGRQEGNLFQKCNTTYQVVVAIYIQQIVTTYIIC